MGAVQLHYVGLSVKSSYLFLTLLQKGILMSWLAEVLAWAVFMFSLIMIIGRGTKP